MPDAFEIIVPTTEVGLSADRTGTVVADITSRLNRNTRIGVQVLPGEGADPSWFGPAEPAEYDGQTGETRQVQVPITVPKEAPAGSTSFQVRAYAIDNPSEDFTASAPIPVSIPRMAKGGVPTWLVALIAAIVLLILGLAGFLLLRGGDDDPVAGGSGNDGGSEDDGAGDDDSGSDGNDDDDGGSDGDDDGNGDGGDDDGSGDGTAEGVDLALFLDKTTCGVVPGGGLEGGDVVTFFFRKPNVGTEPYDGPVRSTALSNTGLTGSSTGRPTEGAASSFVQVEFAPQDYGRTHTFTIDIEPLDEDDVNLSNNEDTIDVPLPETRPSDTFDPCA